MYIDDFASLGLSIDKHPIGMVRTELEGRGVLTVATTLRQPADQVIRVAGIISHRQRPGTASGMVFMTMEDETGMVNLVVRPNPF